MIVVFVLICFARVTGSRSSCCSLVLASSFSASFIHNGHVTLNCFVNASWRWMAECIRIATVSLGSTWTFV